MGIETLIQSVQRNCDLSDREFAADYTICIYLIRMREYYRWEHNIAPDASLDQKALMGWMAKKEQSWDAIESDDFTPVEFEGQQFEPFDAATINQHIQPLGYTYSAGYGRLGKPVFFLGELQSRETSDRYSLTLAGKELARELTAPPAAMQGRDILVRTESVSRLIWDLVEEWRWHKPDNAMAEVVRYYDFEHKPMRALKRACEDQQEVLILHELGELMAEELVSSHWNEMLADDDKHRHLFARAVRDYLADCISTLPGLLAEDNLPGLHFYFASLTPLRKSMFPSLAESYRDFRKGGSIEQLKESIKCGQTHWLNIGNRLVDDFVSGRELTEHSMQRYIEQYAL